MSEHEGIKTEDVIIDDYIKPNIEISVTDEHTKTKDVLNGYTRAIEEQINKIYIQCQEKKFLHEYSENACLFRSKILGYPSKFLSTITASLASINLVDLSFSPLGLAIISIVSSIVNMTDSFMDSNTKFNMHKVYKHKFHMLITNIEKEMIIERSKRMKAIDFLSQITDQYISYCNGNSPSFCIGSQNALNRELENNKEIDRSIFKLHNLTHTPTSSKIII